MSESSVLYDAPGPRARRRALIGSVVTGVLVVVLLVVVARRLAAQGQFDGEKWSPLFNPGDENFAAVWQAIGSGAQATLTAASLAIAFALVLGTALGVARMLLGRAGRVPIVGLIELLRGLPVVVTIFFAYRVLPDVGVDVSPLPGEDGLWYLVIGLTAYNMVIIAEILRAGVASLPRGQSEAAMAIGMTPGSAMRVVLLPQAFRVMLPALISQIVVILKDTSLAAVLGIYTELLRKGRDISGELNNPIQTYLLIGFLFVVTNYALSRLAVFTERRVSGGTKGAVAPRTVTETSASSAA